MTKAREIAELGQKLTVDGSGNLDIAGTVEANNIQVEGATGGLINLYRSSANANFDAITFKDTTNTNINGKIGWNANELRLEGTNTARITAGGSDKFFANSSGVGINTSAVDNPLEVLTSANDKGIVLKDDNNDLVIIQRENEQFGRIRLLDATSTRIDISARGDQGFKTLSVPAVFNENGGDNDFRVESDTYSNAIFVNAGTGEVNFDGARTNFGGINVETADGEINAGLIKLRNSNTTSGQFLSIDAEGTSAGQSMIHYWYDGAYRNRFQVAGNTGATVVNESGLDVDFRVESDNNSHALFVNAGDDTVYVGKAGAHYRGATRTFELAVDTGIAIGIGASAYTYGLISDEGTQGDVNIIANAYPANLGSDRHVRIKTGSAGGGGPDEIANFGASTGAVFNDNGQANKDFRVESDTYTHALFVDAGAGIVSVFNSSPVATYFQVGGDTITTRKPTMSISGGDSGGVDTSLTIRGGSPTLAFDQTSGGSTRILMDSTYINFLSGDLDTFGNNVFKLASLSGQTTSFNDDGIDLDFRIESDSNNYMFFLDASVDRISIGSSSSMNAQLTVQNSQNNGTVGHLAGNTISNGGVRPACLEMIHAISTVSSGTVLTIPITSQGGLWNQYQVELMVVTGEYNMNTTAKGGSAKFSFTSLNVIRGFVQQEVTGNISSISVTQNDSNYCEIRVNFSSGYISGSSSRNGVQVYAKVLSDRAQYFELENATLN